ncbi:MAG: hypothetical protein REI94_02925 [Moraxellaceae bacterium]|nr:hypothetical protein [Moraxellaceae bacterium]
MNGGCGAAPAKVITVTNRLELVRALYGGGSRTTNADGSLVRPDDSRKIIYVQGSIDLNVDDSNASLTEEDYMAQCSYTTHANHADFFAAYLTAYDPNTWNSQSLESDNKPPAVHGPLEDARVCFQQKQAERIVLRVGSNTSIIGKGTNAVIKNGNLRLGQLRTLDATTLDAANNYKASNIVIRNITFEDSYDMFPGWDAKDSFSITASQLGTGNCSATHVDATVNPNACASRKGGRWNSEYDLISVENAENVWVDHNTFNDGSRTDDTFPIPFASPYNEKTQKVQHHDGAVDVTAGATRVTISYNTFKEHDKTNLLGGSDTASALTGYGPGKIDVTFHDNYWENTVQRMPRVRFGRVHVFNNYYNVDWNTTAKYQLGEAWTLGTASKIFAESNVFEVAPGTSPTAAKLIGYSSSTSNRTKCTGAGFTAAECGTYFYEVDTVLNGAVVDVFAAATAKVGSNAPLTKLDPALTPFWTPAASYSYTVRDKADVKAHTTANAGAGKL